MRLILCFKWPTPQCGTFLCFQFLVSCVFLDILSGNHSQLTALCCFPGARRSAVWKAAFLLGVHAPVRLLRAWGRRDHSLSCCSILGSSLASFLEVCFIGRPQMSSSWAICAPVIAGMWNPTPWPSLQEVSAPGIGDLGIWYSFWFSCYFVSA